MASCTTIGSRSSYSLSTTTRGSDHDRPSSELSAATIRPTLRTCPSPSRHTTSTRPSTNLTALGKYGN
ncbi:hypothetical protein GCM10027269_08650 [Kribbella endophytica]